MNTANKITCPKCSHQFNVDEVLTKGIEEKLASKYATEYAKKEEALKKEAAAIVSKEQLLLKQKEDLQLSID